MGIACPNRPGTRVVGTLAADRHTVGVTSQRNDGPDDRGDIDPRNNPESRATERSAVPQVTRSGSGSVVRAEDVPPTPEPAGGDSPGTAAGDPLGGLTMSEGDSADAVTGQDGPEPVAPGQN